LLLPALFLSLATQAQSLTWEELNTGTQKNIRDLFFVNAQLGFAVGDDSLFIRTTDGGDTWTSPGFPGGSHPSGNAGNISAIAFTSSSEGMLAYTFIQQVLKTSDGGDSWNDMVGNNLMCNTSRILLPAQFEGYLVGRGCFGGAYVSAYGGFGWSAPILVYYGPGQGGLNSIAKDPVNNILVAVGDEGLIIRTEDAFVDFDTIVTSDNSHFTSVDYAGNNTFYLATGDLYDDIMISTDGGQSFHADTTYLTSFFYPEVRELDFIAPEWGIAAGWANDTTDGIIMHKEGPVWSLYSVDEPLNAVHVVDSTIGFVGGNNGKIYRFKRLTGLGDGPSADAQVQIYPNPAAGGEMLQVKLAGLSAVSRIELCNLQGTVMHSVALSSEPVSQLSYMLPDIAGGMYFLRLFADGKMLTKKIVIR